MQPTSDVITECYFCRDTVPSFSWRANDTAEVECRACGPYRLLEPAARKWYEGKWHDSLHILSGAIRNQNEQGIKVIIGSLDDLGSTTAVPQGPLERIDNIVLHLLRKMDTYDATVALSPTYDYPLAYAKNPKEFEFLVSKSVELGYVELAAGGAQYRLTVNGWQRTSVLDAAKRLSFSSGYFTNYWFSASSDQKRPSFPS